MRHRPLAPLVGHMHTYSKVLGLRLTTRKELFFLSFPLSLGSCNTHTFSSLSCLPFSPTFQLGRPFLSEFFSCFLQDFTKKWWNLKENLGCFKLMLRSNIKAHVFDVKLGDENSKNVEYVHSRVVFSKHSDQLQTLKACGNFDFCTMDKFPTPIYIRNVQNV